MTLEFINIDDPVVYIPHYLLMGDKDKMVEDKNLGIVVDKNDIYVFVRYGNNESVQFTYPKDLFTLKNRPDLIERLNEIRNYSAHL